MAIYQLKKQSELKQRITENTRCNETNHVNQLIEAATLSASEQKKIKVHAEELVRVMREKQHHKGGMHAFMLEYDLSSDEGISLMCLAEALLRIPDKETQDKLIQDKLGQSDWASHLGQSHSMFVNAGTWGLMMTGKLLDPKAQDNGHFKTTLTRFLGKSSMPVIRKTVQHAMQILGQYYVIGETIEGAIKRAKKLESKGYRYSYDMLGEAAMTEADAGKYMKAYEHAINAIQKDKNPNRNPIDHAGISIKLSALFSRYEVAQEKRVFDALYPRLLKLAKMAKQANIGFTIDAEESERLELSLDLLEKLAKESSLSGWQGLGLAVQAYQKRAFYVIDWLQALAHETGRKLMVRLVKGAYWDREIKFAQTMGLDGFPVFTRKAYTDVSYIACAKKLLSDKKAFYPQFATHNAMTLATIMTIKPKNSEFEFQCLHGMGEILYDQIKEIPCRIYAPVGPHEHLLAYLVRRLLENGANTSFLNQLSQSEAPLSDLTEDPIDKAQSFKSQAHPQIKHPSALYAPSRKNAEGLDLADLNTLNTLTEQLSQLDNKTYQAYPCCELEHTNKATRLKVLNPADQNETVGEVIYSTKTQTKQAVKTAVTAFETWSLTSAEERANCLERAADLFETHLPELMNIIIKEAGKTLANALADVREAIDFCRYYAEQIRLITQPHILPGPTGESNQLSLHPRGPIVCISPWNFPMAIFVGQVSAALAAGNTVLAKPAEQTPLIAHKVTMLFYEAGIPKAALQTLPGEGEVVGQTLVSDPSISGVMFTGSNETARYINQALAARKGAIIPFIAETGGQNCMIVDSSALLEQVVTDTVYSAFDSAGQRCSAMRVLFAQEDIADDLIEMLKGAMQERTVGNPIWLHTDIGPVIDKEAQANLLKHIKQIKTKAKDSYQTPLTPECKAGHFVPPTLVEINDLSQLKQEVFGPVLHLIRYKGNQLEQVIDQINNTGFGLTFGVHSRIQETIAFLKDKIKVGNVYVNRNMIGAIVGVQPFGGEGLSGTGPKAGGPHYLPRLMVEKTVSVDTTATGGNASLLQLED